MFFVCFLFQVHVCERWCLIGPGAVQLGYIDCEVVVNPTRRQLRDSALNMVVVATENKKVGR